MSKNSTRQVVHEAGGRVLIKEARWCDSFTSHLEGFTFRRELQPGEGLVLVHSIESRVNAGITMLFVFLDLGVLWVNREGEVVDTVLARPWRPIYLPKAPALTVVEAAPEILNHVQVGDQISYL